jgi:membrane protease YdiL (CAAX protease family)
MGGSQMSLRKKPPLLKWWSAAKGNSDDLSYYKKSRKMARVVQGFSIVVGLLITAAKAGAFLFAYTASLSVLAIPAVDKPFFLKDHGALLRLWGEFISLLGLLLATVFFVSVVEKKSIRVSILRNPLRSMMNGFVLGALLLGVSLGALILMGYIKFAEKNNVTYIWAWLIAVLLNAVIQEYLVRGYLFSLFREALNTAAAVILTTILFTVMQERAFEAGFIAVLNTITMSVFASLLLLYTESLLAPVIVRFFWNGIGGIVFGSVSLDSDYPSLWNSIVSGNSLISGGSAKLTGSVITLLVSILSVAFLSYRVRRNALDHL